MCYWQCNGKTLRMWENPADHWYMQAPIRLLGSWHPSLWLCPSKCRFFLFLLTSTTYRKHAVFLVAFNLWTISLRRFRHSKVSLLQEMSQCCGTVVGPGSRWALWRRAKTWNAWQNWHLAFHLPVFWEWPDRNKWQKTGTFLWSFCFPTPAALGLSPHWPQFCPWKTSAMKTSDWAFHTSLALKCPSENFMSSNGLKFYPSQSGHSHEEFGTCQIIKLWNQTLCDWKWDGIMNAALFILIYIMFTMHSMKIWSFLVMFCWPQVLQLWPAKQWASMQKESANSSRHESRKGPACSCESSPRML